MPVNITFDGENIWKKGVRVWILNRDNMAINTKPAPSPSVPDRVWRTLTVGTRNFANGSWPLWDEPSVGICLRRTASMASGESQD